MIYFIIWFLLSFISLIGCLILVTSNYKYGFLGVILAPIPVILLPVIQYIKDNI